MNQNLPSLVQQAAAAAWAESADSIEPLARYVAVSGGLDSMTLLEALARTKPAGAELGVLHVNHALRGAESDGDEALVRERAAALGLRFIGHRLQWKAGEKPSQARCRDERRKFFGRVLAPADLLYLAHHRDDQAETVLLRLLRGTGLRGLRGMAAANGSLRRPFLHLPRRALSAAAEAWGVEWREDGSNADTRYERNWLRAEILPRLEARRPGVADRLSALAAEAQQVPAAETVPLFSLGAGIQFAHRAALRRLPAGGLAFQFALDRRHALGLARLLEKGGGRYEAEGKKFFLSREVLLVEENKARFAPALSIRESSAGWVAESSLGVWHFSGEGRSARDRPGDAASLALGDRAKKEFQAAGTPIFFRAALPFWRKGGAWRLAPLTAEAGFLPSPLARWWLSSSESPGGARLAAAREKILR